MSTTTDDSPAGILAGLVPAGHISPDVDVA